MQEITLTKIIEMEDKITDLLLITIDDNIDTINDKDGIRLEGKVNISGKLKTDKEEKDFFDYIDLDIFLDYEEIIDRNSINVKVEDFSYKIEENKLYVNVILNLEGLKEIETTFLAKENNELVLEKEIEEEEEVKGEQNLDREKEAFLDEEVNNFSDEKDELEELNDLEMEIMNREEDELINEVVEQPEKKSLLKSVFSSKRIKEEVSWRLHCVKNETTYEEIASKYNININKLKSINNNEKLEAGKLIFLPLD